MIRWWRRTPVADALLGVSAAAGYLVWRRVGGQPFSILDAGDRSTVYATLVGVAVGLLAFGLTPVSIVLTLTPGPRAKLLLRHHSDELRRTLYTLLIGLLALLAASLIGLVADTGLHSWRPIRYAVAATMVETLLGSARLIDQFNSMFKVVNVDNASDGQSAVTPLSPRNRRTG